MSTANENFEQEGTEKTETRGEALSRKIWTAPLGAEILGEDGDDDFDDLPCGRCHGEGFLLVCVDDMCHGLGYCMHGDGEIVCPSCKGDA